MFPLTFLWLCQRSNAGSVMTPWVPPGSQGLHQLLHIAIQPVCSLLSVWPKARLEMCAHTVTTPVSAGSSDNYDQPGVQVPKGWPHNFTFSTQAVHPLCTLWVLHSDGFIWKDMFLSDCLQTKKEACCCSGHNLDTSWSSLLPAQGHWAQSSRWPVSNKVICMDGRVADDLLGLY